jgi:UDP-N-acetylglucosamine:LPS N-acetylglucosamine transferase
LTDAFKGHEIFYITYEGARSKELFPKYTIKNLGSDPVKFLRCMPFIFRILRKEKPELIISTGSEIALPVFYIGRLLGIKTMFIESLCRVEGPSLTGRLIYPVSSVFLVQWKALQKLYGKKAQYWGNVL